MKPFVINSSMALSPGERGWGEVKPGERFNPFNGTTIDNIVKLAIRSNKLRVMQNKNPTTHCGVKVTLITPLVYESSLAPSTSTVALLFNTSTKPL